MRSKVTAYLLWCFCFIGLCGIHRIYLGRIGTGILQLITLGGFGIWQLIDLFLIPEMLVQKETMVSPNIQQTQNVVINIDKELFKENGG